MQLAKKILLSLTFTFAFSLTIFYFIWSLLKTINPEQLKGHNNEDTIYTWVFFGLFFISALSSFFWLINLSSGFWLWKVPTLLILPFTIPFLIIDYLEFKNSQNREKTNNDKSNQQIFLIMLIVIITFNILIVLLQVSFLPVPIAFSKWFWFLLLIPLSIICGTIFLILSYFYPKKILIGLSYLGLTINWFYLFFNIIEKKQINYFFEPRKIKTSEQTNT